MQISNFSYNNNNNISTAVFSPDLPTLSKPSTIMFASIFKAFSPVMSWGMAISELYRSGGGTSCEMLHEKSPLRQSREARGCVAYTDLEKLGCTKWRYDTSNTNKQKMSSSVLTLVLMKKQWQGLCVRSDCRNNEFYLFFILFFPLSGINVCTTISVFLRTVVHTSAQKSAKTKYSVYVLHKRKF